jgi:hypothetical protein
MRNNIIRTGTICVVVAALVWTIESCKKESSTASQPPTLTGRWAMTSMQAPGTKWKQFGTMTAAQIGSGQLNLGTDGTFSANATVTSASLAQSLGVPIGSSALATGTYSSTATSISFSVTSWSGYGVGFAPGTYTLTENSLQIILQLANNSSMTISLSR